MPRASTTWPWIAAALIGLLLGCAESPPSSKPHVAQGSPAKPKAATPRKAKPAEPTTPAPAPTPKGPPNRPSPRVESGAPLAGLMEQADREVDPLAVRPTVGGKVRAIDEKKAASLGIRKVEGTHLTLFTDLPADPDIDELPKVFDLAIPQWCDYFNVPAAKLVGWKIRACLVKDKEKPEAFQAADLMPKDLPPFPYGYQRDFEFWLYNQPSAFYRRHLFLHEGTHAFMFHHLGGGGPAWYTEGVAELCGTHRWAEGKLTLRYFPRSKEETPEWGRIKIIRDETSLRKVMSVEGILAYNDRAHSRTEPYAWCWGLCAFLDGHPRFQGAFRKMQAEVANRRDFNDKFQRLYTPEEWAAIHEQWQLFHLQLDYGYDVARADFEVRAGTPLPTAGATAVVQADKYWQPSGIRLEAGKTYRLTATGRYEVGRSTKPWTCEPGGVTFRYYQGRPLGMLLAAVRTDQFTGAELTGLATPIPIGAGATFTAPRKGTLYLAINESPGGLADNSGTLSVQVVAE